MHTDIDVSLPQLEQANKEGDYPIDKSLSTGKYDSYKNFVKEQIPNFSVQENIDLSEIKAGLTASVLTSNDDTLLSSSTERNLLLNDLTEIDSFCT